jgi:histidine triad (HIT) family protein
MFSMADCIFCGIVQGKIPASIIHEEDDVISFLDINPVQRGHTLVIPKRHLVDIWDIEPQVFVRIMEVTKSIAHRLQHVMDAEGVNTFNWNASGRPAGQDIYHFHMHVIPLVKDERTKFAMWWKTMVRYAETPELDALAKALRF